MSLTDEFFIMTQILREQVGNNGPKSTCASAGEGELVCGRNSYPFIAAFLRAHLFCPIPGDPCRAWNPATVAFPS